LVNAALSVAKHAVYVRKNLAFAVKSHSFILHLCSSFFSSFFDKDIQDFRQKVWKFKKYTLIL